MAPKLYRAQEVCDLAQVQPYVLRSWEKEFPGIGVSKADGQRLYRQSDVEQVLRIKQLVFTEGLTLSGARRRIEESQPAAPTGVTDDEVNYGVSPGDEFHPLPYAYVGPWTSRIGPFWNAPFGAFMALRTFSFRLMATSKRPGALAVSRVG